MSHRLVTPKCPYICSRKIYGALDLIEKNRKKHSKGNFRYSVKKSHVKKTSVSKRSDTRTVSRLPQVDEREKTKLSQLLTVYGEQNSPAYRQGFDIKNYRPYRPHLPELTTPAMTRTSVLRTSSNLSLLQDRPPSPPKSQGLTLPDINKKSFVWSHSHPHLSNRHRIFTNTYHILANYKVHLFKCICDFNISEENNGNQHMCSVLNVFVGFFQNTRGRFRVDVWPWRNLWCGQTALAWAQFRVPENHWYWSS